MPARAEHTTSRDQTSPRRPQRDDILKIPRRVRKIFLLEREVGGSKLSFPDWNRYLDKELQLRKEALRLVREEQFSIEKALWTAYNNPHHRIEHRLTLLTIANARGASTSTKASSSSTTSNSSAHVYRGLRRSSPSANERCTKPNTLPAPQGQLALPAPPTRGGGRGRGKERKGQCYVFQKRQCTANPCPRVHCCIGCGKTSVSCESCHSMDNLVSVSA